jgi:hypothetical protein
MHRIFFLAGAIFLVGFGIGSGAAESFLPHAHIVTPGAPAPTSDRLLNPFSNPPKNTIGPSADRFPPPAAAVPTFDRIAPPIRPTSTGILEPIQPDPQAEGAKAFRAFLRTLKGDTAICYAINGLYNDKPPSAQCEGKIVNSRNTVTYSVTTTDSVAGTYELELMGKSSELALGSQNWVERHRFYVSLGFNANLEPQIVVVDFEPMLRTTPQLSPEQDELFEYIAKQHDSELRVLQERIKSSISRYVQTANQKFVEAGAH